MLKKFGAAAYSTTLASVQQQYKTVQEVHADFPGDDEFIFHPTKKEIILLPEKCFVDNIDYEATPMRTKGLGQILYKTARHSQFSMMLEVKLVGVKRVKGGGGPTAGQAVGNPDSNSEEEEVEA